MKRSILGVVLVLTFVAVGIAAAPPLTFTFSDVKSTKTATETVKINTRLARPESTSARIMGELFACGIEGLERDLNLTAALSASHCGGNTGARAQR